MTEERDLRGALEEGVEVRMRVVGIDTTTVLGPAEESTITGRGTGERSIEFDERFKGWPEARVDYWGDQEGEGTPVLALIEPEEEMEPEVAGAIVEWTVAEE